MLTRLDIFKWLLAAWIMLGADVCAVWAYTPTSQTTQTYQLHTVSSAMVSSYGASGGGAAASSFTTGSSHSRTAVQPTYQFQSTSAFSIPTRTTTTFTPLADQAANGPRSGRIRKSGNPWEEDPGDDDNPIGVVPEPIGSPLVLLVLAMLYLAVRIYRRKVE